MNAIPDYMQLREKWGRLAQLGTAEVILGIVALSTIRMSVAAAVVLFGWILVVSGILEAVQAFQFRKPLGFFLHIISGVAAIPIGLLMATGSATKPFAWTLLFGSIFIVVGLLRIIAAFVFKFPGWRWVVFDGSVTLLFAILLWAAWPWWAAWFFGLALGTSLVLRGWSSIVFALGLRSVHPQSRSHLRAV
jgi:uncharacterized membrane protein HdeD (DUF308 family)